MASNTPDVRILVGNLGDALPSGESATLIRTNLEKALSAGIKIKITPDTSALTGSSGKSTAFADFTGAAVSTRAMSQATAELTKQRLAHNAALQKENLAYQQNMHAIQQAAALAKSQGQTDLTQQRLAHAAALNQENLAHQQNINASKQAIQASKEEAQAAKTRTTIMAEELKQNQLNTKSEQQRAKSLQQSEKTISSMRLQLARFNEYLTTVNPKALTQFSGEISNIRALLGSNVPTDAQKATAAINRLKAGIKSAGYEGGNAITYIGAKLKTFATYLISSSVTMGFVNGVRTMIENVKDLDEALTDLRIVTGSTREETQELLETYNQMAQRVGSTTSEVASSATSWMRQGYNLEDTDKLIETSMVFSKVGFLDADEAAQALTSTIKGYKLAVEDAMGAIDAFTVLDLDLATSAGEIATALAKTASSAEMAGISLEKAASQIGVVLEVTQASGEEIGNFYKTLMARLSNIKAGRLEDPETGESLDTWGIAA